jgi:hypothetical protein
MNESIWSPKGMVRSACCKIPYKGYEISIAMDDNCGVLDTYGRSNIRVFRDYDNTDVTSQFWVQGGTCSATAEALKYLFSMIDMFGDRS